MDIIWFSGSQPEEERATTAKKGKKKSPSRTKKTNTKTGSREKETRTQDDLNRRSNTNTMLIESAEDLQMRRTMIDKAPSTELGITPIELSEVKSRDAGKRKNAVTGSPNNMRPAAEPRPAPTVSNLFDHRGNFSAQALAKLEPNGHVLAPQPFMAGISVLKEQLQGVTDAPHRQGSKSQQRQGMAKTTTGNDRSFPGMGSASKASSGNANSLNYASNKTQQRSKSKETGKNLAKKKMLLDAYSLV